MTDKWVTTDMQLVYEAGWQTYEEWEALSDSKNHCDETVFDEDNSIGRSG